jgi:hypothetical protein
VTVVEVLTEETVAAKLAVVAPEATVTEAGTTIAGLLLTSPTVNPPVVAATFSVTVQLSVPAPLNDPVLQLSALREGPLPFNCTPKVLATLFALAVSVTVVEVLTEETVAAKLAVVAPEATVTEAGTVTAALLLARPIVNPPLPAAELKVTVQLSVPAPLNDPVVQLSALREGPLPFNCTPKVWVTPFALAVSVTVVEALTEETVAAKLAVVAPGATVTEAGTTIAALLLARPTVNPPVVAATFSVTVQLSVPAPAKDPLLQLSALNTGTPVPLRLIRVELPLTELLVSVSWPVADPAVFGSNCTVSAAV